MFVKSLIPVLKVRTCVFVLLSPHNNVWALSPSQSSRFIGHSLFSKWEQKAESIDVAVWLSSFILTIYLLIEAYVCVTDYEQWCGLRRWQRNMVRLTNRNSSRISRVWPVISGHPTLWTAWQKLGRLQVLSPLVTSHRSMVNWKKIQSYLVLPLWH